MAHEVAFHGSATGKSAPRQRRRRRVGAPALYIVLLLGAAIALLPFFWMVSTSLMTRGETITRQWLPQVPQVRNYFVAWTEGRFGRYFVNSAVMTLTTLAGLLFTSILAGYAFARIRFIGREV